MYQRKRKSPKKKTPSSYVHRKIIEKKIKEAPKKGLKCCDLLEILRFSKHFLGVYPADFLSSLYIHCFPAFLIVNIDESHEKGSHWIALGISKFEVEIFDSLGFNSERWGKFSPYLIKFLNRFYSTHKFRIAPVMQSPFSGSCGLFAAFYIINRQNFSFRQCCNYFSRKLHLNDRKLLQFFLRK